MRVELTNQSVPISNALSDVLAEYPHLRGVFQKQIDKGLERYGVVLHTNILVDGEPFNHLEAAQEEQIDFVCYEIGAWLSAEQKRNIEKAVFHLNRVKRGVRVVDEGEMMLRHGEGE